MGQLEDDDVHRRRSYCRRHPTQLGGSRCIRRRERRANIVLPPTIGPINPGTDLALILAMSNVLINRDLYDASPSVGFDEWAIAGYTPEWAEGMGAATIERLALEFAEAAPAALHRAELARRRFGCSYANSGETARAICLFNTLLGCWNQPGALFLPA